MPTMHEEFLSKLQTATSSILTGGIFTSDDIDRPGGGGLDWAQDKGLISGVTMEAHGILRWKDATEYQANARHIRAELQVAELFMYGHYGQYGLLESAIKPLKDAFPVNAVYSADDRSLYDVMSIEAFGEMPAEEYQLRPSRMVRFGIVQRR